MRITRVDAYALSSPIDPPQVRPFHGGRRTLYKRDVVLVVVETADGERGVAPAGASSSAMREHFEGASQRAFAERVSGPVADALEGARLDEPADCHDVVARADLPECVRTEAASAVDVALHDVAGKRRGAPVYELLGDGESGGATGSPDPLALYASAGMYMSPPDYAEQAAVLEEWGFAGYKYRPGIGPEGDVETVRRIDEAVEEMDVMVDAHTWWKLRDAYGDKERDRVVRACERHGVRWLEEPVAPDDYDGYRDLAARFDVALAGGESEPSADGLARLADTGAVDYLQGDVRHHGGYTGCWRAVEHCRGREVRFVPHSFGTVLGTVANAHLVAATDPGRDGDHLLEYPVFEDDPALAGADPDPGMYPFELAFDVVEEDLDVEDGHLRVPDGPGLGVTADLDVIKRYPFVEGAWTTFEYDDPDGSS